MFYMWIFAPIVLGFYESDVNDPVWKRVWFTVRLQLPLLLFLLLCSLPSYFWINEVRLSESDL